MAGFMNAYNQTFQFVVPFLDTTVTRGLRSEETKFMASPKGVYLFQLFEDLNPVFKTNCLYQVDNNKILICEMNNIAQDTAETLRDIAC